MMSAFVHLKPLLGALYSWITAVDHCNTPQVPAAVLMFLKATMIPEVARTKVRVAPEVEGDHIFRLMRRRKVRTWSWGAGAAETPRKGGSVAGSR
jgi:hypothetical protein